MKKALIIIVAVLIVGGGGYWAYAASRDKSPKPSAPKTTGSQEEPADEEVPPVENAADAFAFDQPKKAAHYVSNTPEHAAILDAVPGQVSITFNFDLSPDSTVTVTKDGQGVNTGVATISDDSLVLTQPIATDSGPGLYTVMYTACWPDGSCHDGQFQFGVKG